MRPRFILLALGIMARAVVGCGAARTCPDVLAKAFMVVPRDATTGALVCDTEVIARDGDFEFRSPAECDPHGPPERPGHYVITISSPGYFSQQREIDTGGLDDCGHVNQVRVDVALVRDPSMPPPDGGGPPVP